MTFAAMKQQADWADGKGALEPWFLKVKADDLASRGQLRKACEVAARTVEVSERLKLTEMEAIVLASMANTEAEFGIRRRAESDVAAALALSRGSIVLRYAAEALAFTGAEEKSRQLIYSLGKANPTDTFSQSVVLPAIRATLEINEWKGRTGYRTSKSSCSVRTGC
jgi:hypothetical protein